MNLHLLILYVATVFVAMIVPGPDMLFVLTCGARGGRRAGVLAALGVASSEVVHLTAAAVGLSALFAAAPAAYTIVRIVGAAYLAFLGVRAILGARRPEQSHSSSAVGRPISHRWAYGRGALTNLLNPKMIMFTVAFLPQFIDRGLGHIWLQFLVLGAIFLVFEILVDGSVGFFSGHLGDLLRRRFRARQAVEAGSGAVMIALAGRLVVERR
jgi:threonine/homoserine/homoserine lactone efflux protein